MPVFERILENLLSSPVSVIKLHLNWRGEPASNPRLSQMLASLVDTPWQTEWHTNATLLSPRRAMDIVHANPHQSIFLSLDGGTKDSFERNRGQGTWAKALAGAQNLVDARGDNTFPRIGVYQLDLGVEPNEYDRQFLSLLDQVDDYIVVPPVAVDGGLAGPPSSAFEIPAEPCFWLGNSLAVDVHGGAWTCLLERGTRLGSLLTDSVNTLLDRALAMRHKVEEETRAVIPGCAGCRKMAGSAYTELA